MAGRSPFTNLLNPEDVPGSIYTRKVAMHCAWKMHRSKFKPVSIVNVGVGAAHELAIWRWLYPTIPILAIDPRSKNPEHRWSKGNLTFVRAVACEKESTPVVFCRKCRSLHCKSRIIHRDNGLWEDVKRIAIDDLAADFKPPYFMWFDIEGGEVDALKGAEQTLKQTGWLCSELFNWTPGHRTSVLKSLHRRGFALATLFSKDGLFYNKSLLRRKRRGGKVLALANKVDSQT